MAISSEQLEKMDEYRTKYEELTKKKISQNSFIKGEEFLPTWNYVNFLESALYQLDKKNKDLREGR